MPSKNANTIRSTRLLIVEGNHERDFFSGWFKHLEINTIQIMPIGGKTLLSVTLTDLVKQTTFSTISSLVIVRDADNDEVGAFQSVCSALQFANDQVEFIHLPIPTMPQQFTQEGVLRIAVIITPGNGRMGALEELLMETVQSDPLAHDASRYVQSAVDFLTENSLRHPPAEHKLGKAKTHAYLATFEEPDKDPGKAALAGVWDFDHPALAPIRIILEQM